ncbi:MAG: hypothetical protein ACTJLK_00825 [Anaplasma sp.]
MEYKDDFYAASSRKHLMPISRRDAAFIKDVQEIVIKIIQQNPGVKERIAESEGTSTETLRMLYGLTSPYVQFLNHYLGDRHNLVGSEDNGMEITSHFLVDADFRKALVGQAIKWALAATNEHAPKFDVDSTTLLLSKADTQNCASNRNQLPIACTAVFGLMESVLFLVQAIKRGESDINELIPRNYLRPMSRVEGLNARVVPQLEVLWVLGQHKVATEISNEHNIPSCVRDLAMVEAMRYAILEREIYGSERGTPSATSLGPYMDNKIITALTEHNLESRNNRNGAHLDLNECVKQASEKLHFLKDRARKDHKHPYFYIHELTMYGVVNTVRELTHDRECSVAELEKIAKSEYEHVGELLAEQEDKAVHKRLLALFCATTSTNNVPFQLAL